MKNKLFQCLLLTLIVASPIFAQSFSDNNNRFSFGPKVGLNLSNVYDTQGDEFEADTKLGFAGGVFFSLPLTNFIGLQPELLFTQKGYQGSGSVLGGEYSFKRTTNYIDVPLLLAVRTGKFLTILVGPQYSFLLSQHYTFDSDLINISQDEEFENENLRKNTLCLTTGVDLNFGHLVVGARGGWDVLSNKGDGTSSTPRYKNMWYQATVGYRF
jgi:hypothetical protein